jgi:RNA polymerase sigma-70 factor (ECF subfamily)
VTEPSSFGEDALGHLDALYATARRLTRDAAEAEDLVQETYVKAFRNRRRFEAGTNLRAWLFTILHNTFLNDIRKKKGSPVQVDDDAAARAADRRPAPGPSAEEALLAKATAAEVDAALESLPEAFRTAVWLRDVQDLPYAEIAKVLDVPIGTVMSRIARGRRLLHDRLAENGRSAIQSADPGVKAKGT